MPQRHPGNAYAARDRYRTRTSRVSLILTLGLGLLLSPSARAELTPQQGITQALVWIACATGKGACPASPSSDDTVRPVVKALQWLYCGRGEHCDQVCDEGDSLADGVCLDHQALTLNQAAQQSNRVAGSAMNTAAMSIDEAYRELLLSEFGGFTPENATKWGPLQPNGSTTWSFDTADTMVAYGQEAGRRVKGHALVWHTQMPWWVAPALTGDPSVDATFMTAAMNAHIINTLTHFGDAVPDWDVANEVLNEDGSWRHSPYYDALGSDYIAQAFVLAAETSPATRLFYNDYNVEGLNAKSDAMTLMLADLLNAGVRVDGVGLQMHLKRGHHPSRADIAANMTRLAALGLTVHVSEMDVRIGHLTGPESERLLAQAMTYYDVAAACVSVPACEQLGFWGYTDRYSWIDSHFGEDDPLLYDEDLNPKPARAAVIAALLGLPMAGCEASRLLNGDLELGTSAHWSSWGGATVSAVTSEQHPVQQGQTALLTTNRSASWQGPVHSVLGLISDSVNYQVQAWVRLGEGATVSDNHSAKITMKVVQTLGGVDTTHYLTVSPDTAVTSQQWTKVSGSITLTLNDASELTQADLYIEGPPAGIDLYVDSVSMTPTCPDTSAPVPHF